MSRLGLRRSRSRGLFYQELGITTMLHSAAHAQARTNWLEAAAIAVGSDCVGNVQALHVGPADVCA